MRGWGGEAGLTLRVSHESIFVDQIKKRKGVANWLLLFAFFILELFLTSLLEFFSPSGLHKWPTAVRVNDSISAHGQLHIFWAVAKVSPGVEQLLGLGRGGGHKAPPSQEFSRCESPPMSSVGFLPRQGEPQRPVMGKGLE